MNTRRAIAMLNKQLKKLDDPTEVIGHNWVIQTSGFIEQIFGKESVQFTTIVSFDFSIRVYEGDTAHTAKSRYDSYLMFVRDFIINCIESVEAGSIIKKPNLLQRFSNPTIVTFASAAIPAIFGIGFFFGNLKYDKDQRELEQRVEQLRDSLAIFTPFISADSPTYNKGTSHQAKDTTKPQNAIQ